MKRTCGWGLMLSLFLGGCAKQGYPPGGPVDKTGPIIVASHPDPQAVNVPVDVRPWIQLDEWPDRGSIESAVFISPEPLEGFDVKVRGKKIFVRFGEELPQNRTVVVTFGAGIRDVNGNQMAESFVLAFSTGAQMDRAEVRGFVAALDNPGATWIWGYPSGKFAEPDPRRDKAPFAAQPDLDGSFRLSFLPPGEYRLFAVEELRRNRLWDSDREALAVPPEDIRADTVEVPFLSLRLKDYDLQPPSLRSAAVLHRQALRLSFDEPVRSEALLVAAHTEDGRKLSIIDKYQDPADSSAILLTTAIQRQGDVYFLRLDSLMDFAGNRSDSIVAEVEASTLVDSIGPRFTWSQPRQGDAQVELDADLRLGFSEAVTLTDLPRAVTLYGQDSVAVDGRWRYPGSNLGIFETETGLAGNVSYTLAIDPQQMHDIFGNPSSDSLVTIHFTTLDAEKTGSISGEIHNFEDHLRIVAQRSD